ncbi:hypothetical protein [Enterococcus avium]|uniref:hypothetical protein n=2 Tax=Enterococcus TaxID=1350 RepID=UPI000FDD5EB7
MNRTTFLDNYYFGMGKEEKDIRTKVLARQRGWDFRQSLREKISIIVFGSLILAATNLLRIMLLVLL